MTGGFLKKSIVFLLATSFFLIAPKEAKAGLLTSPSIALGDQKPLTENTHTISFKLATTWKLRSINVQYYKKDGDLAKPANLSFGNAMAGSISGLPEGHWSVDLLDSSTGLVKLVNNETDENATELTQGTEVTFSVDDVKNPELGDCTDKLMRDTCWIHIETKDLIGNSIDGGDASYNIEEDPYLAFMVSGVESGEIHNGITTNIATDYDQVDFGRLKILDPKFGAQKLSAISNNPNGYEVKAKLDGYIQGLYPANKISPFGPPDITWDNPGDWDHPFGSVCNPDCSDTGWIGANTSDTRIGGNWASGSGKFGPVSTTRHVIMKATSRDTGTDAYVTYGIEVNQNQPPDNYAGTVIYEVLASY